MRNLVPMIGLLLLVGCAAQDGRDYGLLRAQSAVNEAEHAAKRADRASAATAKTPDQIHELTDKMQGPQERSGQLVNEGETRLKNLGVKL